MGMSTRVLKVRIMEHKSRIRNKISEAPLVIHFIIILRFFAFFKCKLHPYNLADVTKTLPNMEDNLIFNLNSVPPVGLNQSLDLSIFL